MSKMFKKVWYDRVDRVIVVIGLVGFLWGYSFKDFNVPLPLHLVVGVVTFYILTPILYFIDLASESIKSISARILGIKKPR